MTIATTGASVFGLTCDNPACEDTASVDVNVIDVNTGATARDLFVCADCVDEVNAPSGYCVVEA